MQIARERNNGGGRYPRKAASCLGNVAEQGVQCVHVSLWKWLRDETGQFLHPIHAAYAILLDATNVVVTKYSCHLRISNKHGIQTPTDFEHARNSNTHRFQTHTDFKHARISNMHGIQTRIIRTHLCFFRKIYNSRTCLKSVRV